MRYFARFRQPTGTPKYIVARRKLQYNIRYRLLASYKMPPKRAPRAKVDHTEAGWFALAGKEPTRVASVLRRLRAVPMSALDENTVRKLRAYSRYAQQNPDGTPIGGKAASKSAAKPAAKPAAKLAKSAAAAAESDSSDEGEPADVVLHTPPHGGKVAGIIYVPPVPVGKPALPPLPPLPPLPRMAKIDPDHFLTAYDGPYVSTTGKSSGTKLDAPAEHPAIIQELCEAVGKRRLGYVLHRQFVALTGQAAGQALVIAHWASLATNLDIAIGQGLDSFKTLIARGESPDSARRIANDLAKQVAYVKVKNTEAEYGEVVDPAAAAMAASTVAVLGAAAVRTPKARGGRKPAKKRTTRRKK